MSWNQDHLFLGLFKCDYYVTTRQAESQKEVKHETFKHGWVVHTCFHQLSQISGFDDIQGHA